MKINRDKVRFCLPEVRYFFLLTQNGVMAGPSKVLAINNMPRPRNVRGTETFLGMVTYLSKFVPKISDIAEPLRKLCKQADFL